MLLAEPPGGRARPRRSRSRPRRRRSPSASARSGGSASSTGSRWSVLIGGAVVLPLVVTAPVPPPALHDDPRLRHLRPLAHRAHRLGRPAVARSDGLRRHRGAAHRRLHPGHQRRHRVGRDAVPRTPGIEALPFGPSLVFSALDHRGHRRAHRRRAPCGCAASTWPWSPSPSASPRSSTSTAGRSCTVTSPTRCRSARTDIFGIDLTLAALRLLRDPRGPGRGHRPGRRRLRATGIGRGTIAVRDNPDTAAAYTVSTHPDEAPGLRPGRRPGRPSAARCSPPTSRASPATGSSRSTDSLMLVAIVVIGGLGSVAGAVLGAVWVIGLPAFFPDNDLVPLLTSSIGLLVLLLYFPGGLVQIGYGARAAHRRAGWRAGSAPPPAKAQHAVPARNAQAREPLAEGVPALRADEIVVSFGGIRAVDGASIEVGDGEIVGLIGTNGAGKSTLMNAIGGFVPVGGHRRAVRRDGRPLGVGRGPARAWAAPSRPPRSSPSSPCARPSWSPSRPAGAPACCPRALFLPPADPPGAAAAGRGRRAHRLPRPRPLRRHVHRRPVHRHPAHRRAGRACSPSTPGVLCLDEPTAGVAQRETEAFGPLIKEIRRELGASMLVIEHDMPLIMSISDRVYCLELGPGHRRGRPRRGAQRPGGDRQLPRHRRAGHRPQRRRRRRLGVLGRARRLTTRGDQLPDLALVGGH